MNFVDTIKDFFNMLLFYINYFINLFKDGQLNEVLQYLFLCIPVEIRGLLIIFPMFLLLTGFFRALKD